MDTFKTHQEDFESYIAEQVLLLQEHLYLHEWHGTITGLDPTEDAKAKIHVDYKYLQYRMSVDHQYLWECIEDGLLSKATEVLVHELCHIIVDQLYKFGMQAASTQSVEFLEEYREQAVQRVAGVALRGLSEEMLVGYDYVPDSAAANSADRLRDHQIAL